MRRRTWEPGWCPLILVDLQNSVLTQGFEMGGPCGRPLDAQDSEILDHRQCGECGEKGMASMGVFPCVPGGSWDLMFKGSKDGVLLLAFLDAILEFEEG